MSAIRGERVRLRERGGAEIELIVSGDEHYATYQTPDGYPVVYDGSTGRFCHARVVNGSFESSGVPAALPPPPGAKAHIEESTEARLRKSAQARARRGGA